MTAPHDPAARLPHGHVVQAANEMGHDARSGTGRAPRPGRVRAGLAAALRHAADTVAPEAAPARGASAAPPTERALEELELARDALVQTGMLRVAGEMASGLAHEFNNLLGAVLGRAQLMRRGLEQGDYDPAEMIRGLEVLERVARDGAETVRRLHLFGRANAPDAPREAVDLDTVIEDAIEFTRPHWSNAALASGRHITIEHPRGGGARVDGHAHELRELFTNLILNAAQASPEGGTIRLRARVRGERVVAEVEDEGLGMSDAIRQRLFEPFFTTRGPDSAGLGLSVVYGIVRRHAGTIGVVSEPGHGACFEISLPLGSAPLAMPAGAPLATATMEALDVLVIDDEPTVRDLMADILRAFGHRVTTHATGLEALSAYIPGRFQLVLTDIGMPGITGWQVADVVRALDPGVMLAFVTGWSEDIDRDALRLAEVDAVIPKPFTIESVLGVVHSAVGRAHENGPHAAPAPSRLAP